MNRFLKKYHLLIVLILIINQIFSDSNTYAARSQANQGFLQADFTILDGLQSGCCPFDAKFQESSSSTAGKITEWKWYFGDGDSSPLKSPDHIYTKPGIYDVTLKITTDSGYTNQVTKTDFINCIPMPAADFMPKPSFTYLSKPIINFENLTGNETPSTTYSWYFDDYEQYNPSGGISNLKNPTYKYSDTAHYRIMLVATNDIRCSDTAVREVIVVEDPIVRFPNYYLHNGNAYWYYWGPKIYKFYPILAEGVVEMYVEIFNLSGKLVFKSDVPKSIKWEGTYLPNNSPAPSGLYIVRIKYRGFDNIWYTKTSKIILEK